MRGFDRRYRIGRGESGVRVSAGFQQNRGMTYGGFCPRGLRKVRTVCQRHSSSERVRYFTERVRNASSD